MRYFTYISDAKLDQLYGQLPRRLISRFAGQLQIDVAGASVSVSTMQSDVTRFDRLRLVERYIEQNCDVRWMTEPRSWFRGELGLRSGILDGAVLHTGLDHDTLVALVGSSRHLVNRGTPGPECRLEPRSSDLPALVTLMERHAEEYRAVREAMHFNRNREDGDEQDTLREVMYFAQQMRGPRESCEFLARRLLDGVTTGPDGRRVHVVIGTPLYVALSDE